MKNLIKGLYLTFKNPNILLPKLKLDFAGRRLWKAVGGLKENPSGEDPNSLFLSFPESKIAHQYCFGQGLEIGGSAHNPFGLDTLNVDLSDSMDTIFKKREVDLCGGALPVNIVAPGDNIPLPDESQDFVVSSHVIEHFPDPIKALLEWDRLIKVGGIIFMIVPHKDRTFDKGRESTPLDHLIEDYRDQTSQPHEDNISGHDHCWTTDEFVPLIRYMILHLGVQWKIEEILDVDDKVGNGFTVVLRKLGTRKKILIENSMN
jgi:SAM-dependent methyltransferase